MSGSFDKGVQLFKTGASSFMGLALRSEEDTLFGTLEDFGRMPENRRLVVIGGTGSGKSTLLNVMAGYGFKQSKETDYEFKWSNKNGERIDDPKHLLFESQVQVKSTTQHCGFASVRWRNKSDVEIIVLVDTPGYDDTGGYDVTAEAAQEFLGLQAEDLHNKLKAMGHIHTLLVIHNDVVSNKINPGTFEILRMVDKKFASCGTSVWDNVVIGYSKCNGFETSWRGGLEKKKREVQQLLKTEFADSCTCDVPVIALGGGESADKEPEDEKDGDGFEQLYKILSKAAPLSTTSLQPFEGTAAQFRKAAEERDDAIARAKATLIYGAVCFKLFLVLAVLFFRPSWVNPNTVFDELIVVAIFVYVIGLTDFLNSLRIGLEQHIYPHLPEGFRPHSHGDRKKAE